MNFKEIKIHSMSCHIKYGWVRDIHEEPKLKTAHGYVY